MYVYTLTHVLQSEFSFPVVVFRILLYKYIPLSYHLLFKHNVCENASSHLHIYSVLYIIEYYLARETLRVRYAVIIIIITVIGNGLSRVKLLKNYLRLNLSIEDLKKKNRTRL